MNMQNPQQLTQQQIQQMQMQRQAIANAHNNPVPPNSGVYNPPPSSVIGGPPSVPIPVTGVPGSSTRAYLDQTVLPILMDGKQRYYHRLCDIVYICVF